MSVLAFNMPSLVFKPIVSAGIIVPYAIILAIIIILNRKKLILRLSILALIIIISQRPMLKDQDAITLSMDLDIMFVIDNTVSMNAVDVNNGTRLEAIKKDCKKIMEDFKGANFAVITFANISQIKYPYTNDYAAIEDIIDRLKIIDPNYGNGSSLNLPYDNMRMLLESSNKKEKHKRIVFFMGDGELNGKEANNTNIEKYQDLKSLIDSGAVLGYGSIEGAKVKITESVVMNKLVDEKGFLLDASTNPPKLAISKLNEDNLKKLADNLGINYLHMINYSVLSEKVEEIQKNALKNEENEERFDMDIYYYFSGILMILLLLDLLHYRRNEQ